MYVCMSSLRYKKISKIHKKIGSPVNKNITVLRKQFRLPEIRICTTFQSFSIHILLDGVKC